MDSYASSSRIATLRASSNRLHHMVLRQIPQDVQRVKRPSDLAGKPHHDAPGVLLARGREQPSDHHGGAVVDVGGAGEVEDHHVVVLDVAADHTVQLLGRGDREAPVESHQAGPGRVPVDRARFLLAREEDMVQQRHRHHAVEFQPFQLPRVHHPGRDQPDGHRGDEVDEHRQPQCKRNDEQMFPPDAVDVGEERPVDDVPADLHENPGQDRVGDRLDVSAQSQQQAQHQQRAQGPRHLGGASGADVGHRAHGGARAG